MLNRLQYPAYIKKLCLLLLFTGSFTSSYAQSAAQNYIRTRMPRRAIATLTKLDGLTSNKDSVQSSIQYIDGLGRPVQAVQVKASPNGFDVVQPVTYDGYGREAVKYLLYAASTTSGVYQTNAFANQAAFYNPPGTPANQAQLPGSIAHITTPFAQTLFETSPLNRVTRQGAPGDPWQPYSATDHTVKMDYLLNNDISWAADPINSRQVAFYSTVINADQRQTLTRTSTYVAGDLSVIVSKDENWTNGRGGTVEEYKDKEGHVVLKRMYNTAAGTVTAPLSTYYVYDDYGNLAFVLPPNVAADNVSTISQTTQDNLCYQYRYDERQRLTQKKLPGKGWEFILYNKLDQVVGTQDAVQRSKTPQEWTVTKYDAIGRVVITGIYIHPSSVGGTDYRAAVQNNLVNTQTTLWETPTGTAANNGYTNACFPAIISNTLTVNYYDNYSFAGTNPYPYASGSKRTKGLPSGSLTNVLGTTNMLWNVINYDEKGRNAKSYKQHYLGGGTASTDNNDEITSTYNFNDQATTVTRKHYTKSGGTAILAVTIANTYGYDHMGRKLNTFEQINTGSNILLSKMDYNEIGQLKAKHLHSATGAAPYLQDIDYAYNERGWLSMINNPANSLSTTRLFSEQLNYNLPQYAAIAQFNGNIAEQTYKVYNSPTSGTQTVKYAYDQLNRLTGGTSNTGYSETGITYDPVGNILTLARATAPNAASLSYVYTGNQLTTVTNSGAAFRSYAYDLNGNATSDGLGDTIVYNMLNLPQTVAAKSLAYTYDATGQKLRKVGGANTTEYISGIQYNGAAIDFIQTEEGRIVNSAGVYKYEYTLTDHLGNNRVTFNETNGKVGEDDYYPFGLNVHRVPNAGNKYLYNKKELQEELTQYDYGARLYDPVIARWTSVDPLTEFDRRTTPYSYGYDNPAVIVDPDGMFGDFFQEDGTYLGSDGINDDKLYVVKDDANIKTTTDGSTVTNVFKKSDATNLTAKFGITYSQFKDFVGTVYNEMSTKSTSWKEGAGIFSVLENRGKIKDKSAWDMAQSGGIYGWAHRAEIEDKGIDQGKALAARRGVLTGIMNTEDYSGGAYWWQGVDFHKHFDHMHAYESFYKVGFRFNDSKDDIWHIGNHLSGQKGYNYMFESTGSAGKTTFMKYTDEYQKANHHPKEWP